MTPERARQIIEQFASDDDLIDMATTCSNAGLALHAEMILRDRHPSKVALREGGEKEGQ